jgi:hypothetical protein
MISVEETNENSFGSHSMLDEINSKLEEKYNLIESIKHDFHFNWKEKNKIADELIEKINDFHESVLEYCLDLVKDACSKYIYSPLTEEHQWMIKNTIEVTIFKFAKRWIQSINPFKLIEVIPDKIKLKNSCLIPLVIEDLLVDTVFINSWFIWKTLLNHLGMNDEKIIEYINKFDLD